MVVCGFVHDDVSKWKRFPRHWPLCEVKPSVTGGFLQKGQWHGALTFSLVCASTNGWANNRDAGQLRRHGVHCDIIVMYFLSSPLARSFMWPIYHISQVYLAGTAAIDWLSDFHVIWWYSLKPWKPEPSACVDGYVVYSYFLSRNSLWTQYLMDATTITPYICRRFELIEHKCVLYW